MPIQLKMATTADGVAELKAMLRELTRQEVLVGVPEDTAARKEAGQPSNAELAYIHDRGAPEQNIPARPFMVPGIAKAEDGIATQLVNGAKRLLRGGGKEAVRVALTRAGVAAVSGIKDVITQGIPPPLSNRTLQERARKNRKTLGGVRKGAIAELARRQQGMAPGIDLAKPLVDTGEMRRAITYVIRPRRTRL